jgi:hypothetical protein
MMDKFPQPLLPRASSASGPKTPVETLREFARLCRTGPMHYGAFVANHADGMYGDPGFANAICSVGE